MNVHIFFYLYLFINKKFVRILIGDVMNSVKNTLKLYGLFFVTSFLVLFLSEFVVLHLHQLVVLVNYTPYISIVSTIYVYVYGIMLVCSLIDDVSHVPHIVMTDVPQIRVFIQLKQQYKVVYSFFTKQPKYLSLCVIRC